MGGLKILWNRLKTIKKEIGVLAIVALSSILIIEFWLNNYSANYKFQYQFGQFYLKLCYSYFSAFIFYFFVVHVPRERRKAKLWLYLNNKSASIINEIHHLIRLIYEKASINFDYVNLTNEQLDEALKKINPHESVFVPFDNKVAFENWFEYLYNKGQRIKKLVHEMLILNDSIDSEFLECLTFMDNELIICFSHENIIIGNPNLAWLSHNLYELYRNSNQMNMVFRRVYKPLGLVLSASNKFTY